MRIPTENGHAAGSSGYWRLPSRPPQPDASVDGEVDSTGLSDDLPAALEQVTRLGLKKLARVLRVPLDPTDGNLVRSQVTAALGAVNAQLRADEQQLKRKVSGDVLDSGWPAFRGLDRSSPQPLPRRWRMRMSSARIREFAAWLGLVPRQNSTGGKIRLGGITKRGDRYLRRLLINGASANRHHGRNAEPRHAGQKSVPDRRHRAQDAAVGELGHASAALRCMQRGHVVIVRQVNNQMDPLERLHRINELQRQNEDARERLAERERQLEEDPCKMQDHLLAEPVRDHEPRDLVYTEPIRASYMRRGADGRGLVYRTRGDATVHAPQPVIAASNGDRAVGHDQVARALGTIIAHLQRESAKALAKRDARIRKLETQVETLLTMLGGHKAKSVGENSNDDSTVVELPKFLRRTHAA